MIRINLLKASPKGSKQGKTVLTSFTQIGATITGSESTQRRALVHLFILLIFPGLIYGYEYFNLNDRRSTLAHLRRELATLEEENNRHPELQKEIDKAKADKKALEMQLGIIEDLSKDRLRDVKALDIIQRMIPEKAWLKSIEISRDNRMTLGGNALSDSDVLSFVGNLQRSINFKQVIPKTAEEKIDIGVVKSFNISLDLESDR